MLLLILDPNKYQNYLSIILSFNMYSFKYNMISFQNQTFYILVIFLELAYQKSKKQIKIQFIATV